MVYEMIHEVPQGKLEVSLMYSFKESIRTMTTPLVPGRFNLLKGPMGLDHSPSRSHD